MPPPLERTRDSNVCKDSPLGEDLWLGGSLKFSLWERFSLTNAGYISKTIRPISQFMTHAAKGQYDTNRLEFHRIKNVSLTMTCFEGAQQSHGGWVCGGLVLRSGRGLHTWSRKSNDNGVAGAELGLAVHLDDHAADGRGVTRGTGEGASLGWGINPASTSLRTEAHLTRKSSEAAHGVLSRIIKFLLFHYFWKYCMSQLKSTHTHTHTHHTTHPQKLSNL